MAAKRFRTWTEEEMEQLLRDKVSKFTNEVLKFMIFDLFYVQITGICNILQWSRKLTSVYCSVLRWEV